MTTQVDPFYGIPLERAQSAQRAQRELIRGGAHTYACRFDTGMLHGPVCDPATPFGYVTVRPHGVTIFAQSGHLYRWANRAGARWPCSQLADCDHLRVTFDAHGLVDLETDGPDDIPADELNAWSSDVLRAVLPAEHPAYFVTVGQFD